VPELCVVSDAPPKYLLPALQRIGEDFASCFSGTVPLVKSMVRERKTPGFTQFSILFHAVCAIALP
jgi:hypothetical protein